MKLRTYQEALIAKLEQALRDSHRRVLFTTITVHAL